MLTLDGRNLLESINWVESRKYYTNQKTRKKIYDKELYKGVQELIAGYLKKVDRLTDSFVSGDVSFEDWQKQVLVLIKESHVNLARLGRGGKKNTFAYDYLMVGNDLRTIHYPFFRRFTQQIKNGDLSEKQIKHRSKAFILSSKSSFEKARLRLYENNSEYYARRKLGCINSCPECIFYSQQGWLPPSVITPPGVRCSCLFNCCCSIEIKKL